MFFAKLALFLLFYRIFSCNRSARYLIYAGITVTGLFYIATTLVFGVQCVRRSGESWSQPQIQARCRTTLVINYIQGSFGVLSDLYIFVVPMPFIWALHLPVQKRVGAMAIFAIGVLCVVLLT